jgi:hypothetical protein
MNFSLQSGIISVIITPLPCLHKASKGNVREDELEICEITTIII